MKAIRKSRLELIRDAARLMGRALRYRNYRIFFAGQIVSLVGTWLSSVATSWLVYRLARDSGEHNPAIVLGTVGFAGQIPVFLVTPLAGVWVDQFNRHRILLATQIVSMLQSFALAFLALSHLITIPQVIFLSVVQGLVNAFDMPARQAFVVELIESREDLSNAIALNSSMVHTARLLGPALAGVLIFYVGEGLCFLVDGISYLAVIFSLLMITPPKVPVKKHSTSALHSLVDGVRYALHFPPIRVLLTLVAVTSLMFTSQVILMPIFADKILGGGERTLGILLGASGAGALCGSLYLASRRTVLGLGRVIVASVFTLGIGLITFSLSRSPWLSPALLFFCGAALVLTMASCNTILQTILDDDKRGRIMSLFTMAFIGMAPFGSLLSGWMASHLGAAQAVGICGVIALLAATAFSMSLPTIRPLVRKIYRERGILPPVAEGLVATTEPPRAN